MANLPIGRPVNRAQRSLARDLAVLLIPFVLLAALLPAIRWAVEALFVVMG
jgi:hypothetical protein